MTLSQPTRRLALTVAALAFALLPGCAIARMSVNDPLDAAAVRQLQPGVSTAADVVQVLGAPTDVVSLGRRSAYRYDAEKTKVAGLVLILFNMAHRDTRADRVWVFFDEDQRLTHVASTFATHRTQYALPWSDVHGEGDAAKADAKRKGMQP